MTFSGFDLLWLFFVYSVLGWVLETAAAVVKRRSFVNRGLINGPLCVIYGIAAVVITISGQELGAFWLFVGSMIYATVIEWTAGHLIEKIYHERWWDYSDIRGNFDGYICLPISLLWGILGLIGVKWGNPLFLSLFRLIPSVLANVILWALVAVLAVDILATLCIMRGKSRRIDRWKACDAYLSSVSDRMGGWIQRRVERRLLKAYPRKKAQEAVKQEKVLFAEGCDFYKIALLFFIGALLGDLTETVFCRFTMGRWMSRSSVVWGPFSIVWGFAIAAVTLLLYKYRNRSEGFLFRMGVFLGGAYEYLCSVFTELVFGTVFWDYSDIPFNLGGRINLLYCFFWGIAAVVWFRKLYPVISRLIERIPIRIGKAVTWILIVFMAFDVVVSCMALVRYDQRGRGILAEDGWQEVMDLYYDNARMERVYPNAKRTD